MPNRLMRATLATFSLFVLIALSTTARAGTATGPGYERLPSPQPTEAPDKIEVIEFFWYGCPHCYRLEPYVKAWEKNLPEDVVFIRQPAAFNDLWAIHARAYFAAETLGVVDKIHEPFFDAFHNKNRKLRSEDELAEFFAEHGVEEKAFREAFHSFYVVTKLNQAKTLPPRYGVTGTPSLIVNGKYKVKAPFEKAFSVVDELIEKERAATERPPQGSNAR